VRIKIEYTKLRLKQIAKDCDFFSVAVYLPHSAFWQLSLIVGGGDTAHGRQPRLVSPPTGDNLKWQPSRLLFIYHIPLSGNYHWQIQFLK
jgi:hypothetical protein